MEYRVISDGGHAWLEVPIHLVERVLGSLDAVSGYSYVSAEGMAYLEEDCDLGKFATAYENFFGNKLAMVEVDDLAPECFVRSLPRLDNLRGA